MAKSKKSTQKKSGATRMAERIAEGAVGLPAVAQQKARKVIEKLSGIPGPEPVTSPQSAMTPNLSKEQNVTLTLKGPDKSGRNVVYTGAAISLRFPVGAFPDKTAPPTIEMSGVAGPKPPRTPRAKLTKEERAALPKPTLAERLAKAEKRTAELRAKVETQPSL